ncbi:MAG: iron-containing redox enzyme family protein [Sedimenticola sp.]
MQFVKIHNETELLEWVKQFLSCDAISMMNTLNDQITRNQVMDSAYKLVRQAYLERNPIAEESAHEILTLIYNLEFSSANIERVSADPLPILQDISFILETAILNHEITQIDSSRLAQDIKTSETYETWLRKVMMEHRAAKHEYYDDFLPNRANKDDIKYLLSQETSLDPRFDDILALMQIGTQGQEKMEIASNYWDEMGNGEYAQVHTHLFAKALEAVGASDAYIQDSLTFEAKVSGNLSASLALRRRNYFKAVGYFGVTEYLAPRRFASLVKAWEKNNLPTEGIKYHKLHIKIDAIHGNAWIKNVICPLAEKSPDIGLDIAVGAMIRLNSSKRYLDRLLKNCDKSIQFKEEDRAHAS